MILIWATQRGRCKQVVQFQAVRYIYLQPKEFLFIIYKTVPHAHLRTSDHSMHAYVEAVPNLQFYATADIHCSVRTRSIC